MLRNLILLTAAAGLLVACGGGGGGSAFGSFFDRAFAQSRNADPLDPPANALALQPTSDPINP